MNNVNHDYYEKDGKKYERPTNILNYFAPPEYVEWKVRTGNREANKVIKIAMKHGSRVDELIRTSNKPDNKDSSEINNCWKAWNKWKADYSVVEIEFPKTAYCDYRMLAGTPDVLWGKCLIDIKTSKTIHENYFFQLGAYASLIPYNVKELAILRLDKELGEYEFVNNEKVGLSVEDCILGFNSLLAYYRRYKQVQSTLQPKEKVYDGDSNT